MDVSPTIQHPHGRIIMVTGDDPDANTEILVTVPARRRWRLLSFRALLTTAAGGAARQVLLALSDPTLLFTTFPAPETQAESLTYSYNWAPFGTSPGLVSTTLSTTMPTFILGPNYKIHTITTNIDAADNWQAPHLLVEEWIDP